MAVKMERFLSQYYRTLRFRQMPPEYFARFQDYIKAGDDFVGNMKSWKKDLMHEDAGNWVINDMPDPENGADPFHLEDSEWEKLFRTFEEAFRNLDGKRGDIVDKINDAKKSTKVIAFIDEYFGAAPRPFSYGAASPETENEITQLLTYLNDPDVRTGIEISAGAALREAKTDLNKLIQDIQTKKYNSKPKLRSLIQTVAQAVESTVYNKDTLSQRYQNNPPQIQNIVYNFESKDIDPTRLQHFKAQRVELMNALYKDKDIFSAFKDFSGDTKIVGAIESAKTGMEYDKPDSKDYLLPKRDDELTPWQDMKRWAGDTWTDYMEKYTKLKGDRVYFSQNAKLICKAITGAKIKPTDGLAKIVASAGEIKKNLKSPNATEQFDWFIKTMEELRKTMPKAFDGALKNGRQMKALVSEMMMIAVRDGKIKEAKTAMEILTVSKYGYTTSKIMDALGKENLSIFSDKSLSWNKSEGVQFVTNALDKSIKWAFMGIGYGITVAGNAYRLSGSKFNGKFDSGKVGQHLKQSREAKLQEYQDGLATLQQKNRDDISERQIHQDTLDMMATMPAADRIDDTNIDQRRNELTTGQQNMHGLEAHLQHAQRAQQQAAARVQHIQDLLNSATQEHAQIDSDINDANNRIAQLGAEIQRINNLPNEIQRLSNQDQQLDLQITNANNRIGFLQAEIANPATPAAQRAMYQTELNGLNTMLPNLTAQKTAVQGQITALQQQQAMAPQMIVTYQNAIANLQTNLQQLNNQKTQKQRDITRLTQKHANANATLAAGTHQQNLQDAQNAVTAQERENNRRSIRINAWVDAKNTVETLTAQIDRRDEQIRNWDDNHQDQYKELMAFWDFLETGRNTHTGNMYSWMPGSAKKKQKDFDANKDAIFQTYMNDYTL